MLQYFECLSRKSKFYLLVFIVTLISMYAGLADYDWFWQCELGKAIVTRGDFNAIYGLTWGTVGIAEYLDHEWVTNVLFYGFSLFGLHGVSVAKLVICLAYAAGTCFYLESEWHDDIKDSALIGIGLYLFMMATIFIKVKAYILSVVFLLVEIVFLKRYRASHVNKYFAYMLILLIVWNNMHSGSMPLFFVVAGVFWLTELNFDKKVLAMLPVYVMSLVINPYGYKLPLFDVQHNFDPVMKWLVLDWRCIDAKETAGVLCASIVFLVIFFLIGVDIKKHKFELLMLAVTMFMSFQSARHLIYLAPFFYSIAVDSKYELRLGETAKFCVICFCVGICCLSLHKSFFSENYAESYLMAHMEQELVDVILETNPDGMSDGLYDDSHSQVWTLGLKTFVSGAFPCTRERSLDGYEIRSSATDSRITEIIEKYGLTKFLSTKYNPVLTYVEGNGILYDYLSAHDEYVCLYESDYYYYFVRKDLAS